MVLVEDMVKQKPDCTVRDIRQGFHMLRRPLSLESRVLTQLLMRVKQRLVPKTRCQSKHRTVAELARTLDSYAELSEASYAAEDCTRLLLFGERVIRGDRLCISWTCRGMLRNLEGLGGKALAIVLDAKQSITAQQFSILTVGLMARREEPSSTTAGRFLGRRRQVDCMTSTMRPLAQCLIDAESNSNVLDFLRAVCGIAQQYCHVDLEHQVLQVRV
jgi:hypothetical protein